MDARRAVTLPRAEDQVTVEAAEAVSLAAGLKGEAFEGDSAKLAVLGVAEGDGASPGRRFTSRPAQAIPRHGSRRGRGRRRHGGGTTQEVVALGHRRRWPAGTAGEAGGPGARTLASLGRHDAVAGGVGCALPPPSDAFFAASASVDYPAGLHRY